MAAVPCNVCSKNTNNTYSIQCNKCEKWCHAKCVNLTTAALNIFQKELQNPKGKRWLCQICEKSDKSEHIGKSRQKNEVTLSDIMEKLNNMEQKNSELLKMYQNQLTINQDLRNDIDELKQQVAKLSQAQRSDLDPLEAVKEISEREQRKNNLMVYGCIETVDEDENESDEMKVCSIIKAVCPEVNTSNLQVKRVGKVNPERPRPIRAVLSTQKDVKSVFFRAKELRKIPRYQHLALGFDKTQEQIKEYKDLRKTMLERIQNGEENLRIKYFKDKPKIIKVNVTNLGQTKN